MPSVISKVEAGVATITLSRPSALNALDRAGMIELAQAAKAAATDPEVRVVVLTGEGRAFCAGGDVKAMLTGAMSLAGETPLQAAIGAAGDLHEAIETLSLMPKIVISAVNGVAAGGGVGIALAADLVLAAKSATFKLGYTDIGLSPDGGSTWALTRLIGHRRALELFLTNRTLDAQEAATIGLINRAIDNDQFESEVACLAAALANGPSRAFAETKQLVRQAQANDLPTQLREEQAAIGRSAVTEDVMEGLMAKIQKRAPAFKGR